MSDTISQMHKDTLGDNGKHSFVNKFMGEPDIWKDFPKSNQKDHGLRYNDGKLKWSYVHFESLEPMVRVLMFGAQKYQPFNWQKGLKKDEILESMQRHLAKLIDGEQNDPESGLPHIGHIMCNAMFYQYMIIKEGKRSDDKVGIKGNVSDLFCNASPRMDIRQG